MAKVTVIMPVYNGFPYLPQTVESILKQTLRDFSFMIINDGSIDESTAFLDSITDKRVRVIHQENKGISSTQRIALDLCETAYWVRMDQDDISMPKRLEMQLNYMERHPDVVALGTQVRYFTEKGSIPGARVPLDHDSILRNLLRCKAAMCNTSIMFQTMKTKMVIRDSANGFGEEFDLLLRLAEKGSLVNLDQVLHQYRFHEKQSSISTFHKVRIGTKYMVDCAKRRADGKTEESYEEFEGKCFVKCSKFINRIVMGLDMFSFLQYRRSIIDRCNGNYLRGYFRMALCAGLKLDDVVRRFIG